MIVQFIVPNVITQNLLVSLETSGNCSPFDDLITPLVNCLLTTYTACSVSYFFVSAHSCYCVVHVVASYL